MISIVIHLEIGTASIELHQKLSTNLPVTVGGIIGSLVVLIVGVVCFIFILRYIRIYSFSRYIRIFNSSCFNNPYVATHQYNIRVDVRLIDHITHA